MQRIIMFLGSVVMFILFIPASGWPQDGLPYGDYKLTCQNMRMYGDRLYAECQTRDGGWRGTSIDAGDCPRGIINDNGRLRCAVGGGGYYDDSYYRRREHYGLPPGDYQETCRDIYVEGETLYATCEKRNGYWRDTRLDDFDDCRSPIINDNGKLRCER